MKKYYQFINEDVEFIYANKKYVLKGYYDEFRDYVQPFLKKGEWYRIICLHPKKGRKKAYLKK